MKKIIKQISLVLMLLICASSMAACSSSFLPNDGGGGGNGSGSNTKSADFTAAKIVYSNDENNSGHLLESFAQDVLHDLISVYGYDDIDNSVFAQLLPDFYESNNQLIRLIDSVRYTSFVSSGKLAVTNPAQAAWKITFSGTSPVTLPPHAGQTASNPAYTALYDTYSEEQIGSVKLSYQSFLPLLHPILSAAMYCSALDKPMPTFEITPQNNGLFTITKINQKTETLESYMQALKQEYKDNCLFIGIRETDLVNIKNFIKTEIIGTTALSFSGVSGYDNKFYDEIITAILEKYYTETYAVVPNSTVHDVDISYLSMTLETDFDDAVTQNYQSVLLMPDANFKFDSLIYGFYSEYSFTINYSIKFHNLATKISTVENFSFDIEANVVTEYSMLCHPSFLDSIFTSASTINDADFDNGILKVAQPTPISTSKPNGSMYSLNDYYSFVQTTANNQVYGCVSLNTSLLTSAFATNLVEITFTANKPFKFGFMGVMQSISE